MTEEFKQGMRRLAGAVTIVTAGSGNAASGLTATAICSLTAQPPRLLACLNQQGATFEILRRHGRFCVSVLGSSDRLVAEAFAGMTGLEGHDRFSMGDWQHDPDRPPRLRTAQCAFECQVHSVTMLSTHGLVIGDVDMVHVAEGDRPLLYHDGMFATLA